jgi:hypothetical protein
MTKARKNLEGRAPKPDELPALSPELRVGVDSLAGLVDEAGEMAARSGRSASPSRVAPMPHYCVCAGSETSKSEGRPA